MTAVSTLPAAPPVDIPSAEPHVHPASRLRAILDSVAAEDGSLPPLNDELVRAMRLPDDLPEPLGISEVAEITGITAHTLRYYERIGLVETDRDAAGRRVYDRDALGRIAADVVVDELTDLPDREDELLDHPERNIRIRREGTRNLLDASRDVPRFLVQSVAWELAGERGEAVAELERMVLERGGVVIRYGQLYGPGTFYEGEPPDPPRVHVDEAARRTAELLDAPSGVVTVVDA
jgi:nucleoside-diphosphate-sugar epimerase